MSSNFENGILLAARVLIGGAFVFSGLRKLPNNAFLTRLMATRGVPQARLMLWAGIALRIVAGALVIAGIWTAFAAACLILFLIVATPMFHNFWDYQGPERATRIDGIVVNIALTGGFLALMAQQL